MRNTKRIAVDAILAAIALLLFLVEAQIPAFIPIPGIKLGLANIVTLVVLHLFGKRDAAAGLFVRITLGAVFAGTVTTFFFSVIGGLFCFLLLVLLRRFSGIPLWVHSVFGAVAHNIGRLRLDAVRSRLLVFAVPAPGCDRQRQLYGHLRTAYTYPSKKGEKKINEKNRILFICCVSALYTVCQTG